MRKGWIVSALIAVSLLFFFAANPLGIMAWNSWFGIVQRADDVSSYKTQKKVEDTCRSMIASYEADRLVYEQYKGSSDEEKQSWAEQAKMRANKTASSYNNYILENSFVWGATRYIDLTEQTSETVTVQKGALKEVTLYATRVSNPSGKIETFTASTQKMFTDAVDRADVHCVGAGAGGSSGGGSNTYSGSGEWSGAIPIAEGGQGGEGGKSSFKISVPFQSNKPFDITVGSKGIGGKASSQSSTSCSKNKGTSGGSSECLGVSAKGGANPTTIGAECTLYLPSNQWPVAETASDNETHLFGDSLLQIAGGGDGGGGSAGAYNTSNTTWYHKGNSVGGAPNGGNGGGSVSATGAGKNAKGPGGGGGGGSGITKGKTADQNVTFSGYDGGDGYDGIVYLRWFYA